MHGADIVELDWLFGVRRAFLLCCCDDSHRVHLGTRQKQCGRAERQDPNRKKFITTLIKTLPAHFADASRKSALIVPGVVGG